MESLLPNYVDRCWEKGLTTVVRMYSALYHENLDEMLRLLQAYLLTIPYCDNTHTRGTTNSSSTSSSPFWAGMWMWRYTLPRVASTW